MKTEIYQDVRTKGRAAYHDGTEFEGCLGSFVATTPWPFPFPPAGPMTIIDGEIEIEIESTMAIKDDGEWTITAFAMNWVVDDVDGMNSAADELEARGWTIRRDGTTPISKWRRGP